LGDTPERWKNIPHKYLLYTISANLSLNFAEKQKISPIKPTPQVSSSIVFRIELKLENCEWGVE
jgi:hypothetical protein